MTILKSLVRLTAVLSAALPLVSLSSIPKAHAASISSSCTATKITTFGGGSGQVLAKVNITLNFNRNANGTVTVTSADYSFSDASYTQYLPVALPTFGASITSASNVNVRSPVTRNSPDSMGTAGVYNFADFTVSSNTQVRVEGIPDIRNISDPSCSVYINVA